MYVPAIVELFKNKVVGSIIIMVCWSSSDKVKSIKQFSEHGFRVTITCDPSILDNVDHHFQGVLYIHQHGNNILDKVRKIHFAHWYKWLIIGNASLDTFRSARYDADIAILRNEIGNRTEFFGNGTSSSNFEPESVYFFDDVYVHPRDGVSTHEWAHWTMESGLQVTHDWERILRREDLKQYPMRLAAPVAHYSPDTYKGSFTDYLVDMKVPDAGLRCGYSASKLLIEAVNGSAVLVPVQYWASAKDDNSTLKTLAAGRAELSAGILRIMHHRLPFVDYVLPIWRFHVGFTYLAERESSSNMYMEPFTVAVWWSCLIIGLILALAQRMASRKRREKDGAFIAALATWLQQDADAVPEGITGRWTFTVLSICSMLVHAYYTSAIVSALMSTGMGGPKNLRELADSRYAIASEDHDFIKLSLFNVETNWTDLEYLKKRKMTSAFYQDIEYGVRLMQQGSTAYHAEYHQMYHYLDTLSDVEICKMQHVDTIPETMTWVPTTVRGQWTNILKTAADWQFETGLARRVISKTQIQPPPCRVALLAERVTFGDVAPLLALTTLGAGAALGLLGLEILFAKYIDPRKRGALVNSCHSFESSSTTLLEG